jgi:hypothetical protein
MLKSYIKQAATSGYTGYEGATVHGSYDQAKAYSIITSDVSAVSAASGQVDQENSDNEAASEAQKAAAEALKSATKDAKAAEAVLKTAQSNLDALKTRQTGYDEAVADVKAKQRALEDDLVDLASKKSTDSKAAAKQKLELLDKKAAIASQQAAIGELAKNSSQTDIKAKVAGVIKSLNAVAGKTYDSSAPLATIVLPDHGYCVSFSVTNDKARKVHAGDEGTVSNYYNGEIKATLQTIKPDPSNPQTNRLLVFDLTGDVTEGTSLSISVGERSAQYDTIVPNSAIRSDSNGDFILTVVSKSSPLGNRYIATRVDIEKVASDDTNTAVSGADQSQRLRHHYQQQAGKQQGPCEACGFMMKIPKIKIKKPPKKWLIFASVSLLSALAGSGLPGDVQFRRAQPPQSERGVGLGREKRRKVRADIRVRPGGKHRHGQDCRLPAEDQVLRLRHDAGGREEHLHRRVQRRREGEHCRRPRLVRRLGHRRGRQLLLLPSADSSQRQLLFRIRRDARQGSAGRGAGLEAVRQLEPGGHDRHHRITARLSWPAWCAGRRQGRQGRLRRRPGAVHALRRLQFALRACVRYRTAYSGTGHIHRYIDRHKYSTGYGTSAGTGTSSYAAAASAGSGQTGSSGGTTQTSSAAITCYEAVLPNPVVGFAAGLANSELNADKSCEVVENSLRYTSGSIFSNVLKNSGKRVMHLNGIEYPYWENAARLVESRCGTLLLLRLIFLLCPAVFVCVMLVALYKYIRRLLKAKFADLKDRYEERTLFSHMKGSDDDGGTDA